VIAVWKDERLAARFSAVGISTEELQRNIQAYENYFKRAEEAINKEIDLRSGDRVDHFRRALEIKADQDKRNEAERARSAQVADVDAVIKGLEKK
jgi:hypothetical protein